MNKIIATVLLCSAALSTPAFAQDFATSAPTTPFYAGVQLGDATTFFGGYQIDKTFSAEFLYTKYNELASSMGVYGVAMFPNLIKGKPQVSFFGKAGIVKTTVDFSSFGFPGSTTSSTDLAWGGGAQYDFNKRFSARLGLDFAKYKSGDLYISGIIKF